MFSGVALAVSSNVLRHGNLPNTHLCADRIHGARGGTQTVDRRVHTEDIAATLAILPGTKPTSGSVGEALSAVMGNAG
jgi:hypothetical protein